MVLLLYLEYNRYMMGRRNSYFEGTEDGQMTQPEYPNFNSYVKIYVFWYSRETDRRTDGRTDGQTDRQTETLIRGDFCNYVPPG